MAGPPDWGDVKSQLVTINTTLGRVTVLYDLRCEGDTLHLADLIAYPDTPTPLTVSYVDRLT